MKLGKAKYTQLLGDWARIGKYNRTISSTYQASMAGCIFYDGHISIRFFYAPCSVYNLILTLFPWRDEICFLLLYLGENVATLDLK